MLLGAHLHDVQELALEMLLLLDEYRRATDRTDAVRLALLSSGARAVEDLFPTMMTSRPHPARPAAAHSGPEDEPHPSQLEWGVPTEAEAADLAAWMAQRGGVVTVGELEDGGWV